MADSTLVIRQASTTLSEDVKVVVEQSGDTGELFHSTDC